MAATVQSMQLGNLVRFGNGKAIKPGGEGSYPVYGSNGIIGGSDEFRYENGVIIGRVGAYCGSVAYCPEKFWASDNTLVAFPASGQTDTKFLFYLLTYANLSRYAGGAAQPLVTQTILKKVEVNVPPLPVQRRIAGILSAYDDLIENSRRRIKVLEAMARALYREWFVEYRFPGHETERMVSSPLGEIPEGWEVKKLGELVNVDKGVSYNGAGLTEDGNPMVNLKNILPGGGFRRDATKPYSGDFKDRHMVKPGDVVLANTDLTQAGNVVASPALIPHVGDARTIIISHHLYAVRPLQQIPPLYIYHLMLTDDFRGFAKGFAIGTTVLGLPKEGIIKYAFACPPTALIREFVQRVAPLHELTDTLNDRIENLRKTRDLLLPRLLSGELDVSRIIEPEAATV